MANKPYPTADRHTSARMAYPYRPPESSSKSQPRPDRIREQTLIELPPFRQLEQTLLGYNATPALLQPQPMSVAQPWWDSTPQPDTHPYAAQTPMNPHPQMISQAASVCNSPYAPQYTQSSHAERSAALQIQRNYSLTSHPQLTYQPTPATSAPWLDHSHSNTYKLSPGTSAQRQHHQQNQHQDAAAEIQTSQATVRPAPQQISTRQTPSHPKPIQSESLISSFVISKQPHEKSTHDSAADQPPPRRPIPKLKDLYEHVTPLLPIDLEIPGYEAHAQKTETKAQHKPESPTRTSTVYENGVKKSTKTKEKTPYNSFVIFTLAHRSSIRAASPFISNRDITRQLAEEWGKVSPTDKTEYRILARELTKYRNLMEKADD